MNNLLTFYGACGHTTIETITDEEWSEVDNHYTVTCVGEATRMVYVRPSRVFNCQECVEEESYENEFMTLRFFFRAFSGADVEVQTIALGKSMLPSFNEEKILKIARKV
jgi:hypothetical protein